jgi:hypothetical protein
MSQKKTAAELELLSGHRQSGESDNAVVACNDWLRLGTGRTLSRLLSKYNDIQQKSAPTQSLNTLQQWSAKFDWQARATEFDAGWEARKNAEREAVMGYGLALDYERVNKLFRLADFLEGQIYEKGAPDPVTGYEPYHNVWVPDVKSIGGGEFAERVDIERFNSALLAEYRATLDDIAKEVGGRVKKADVTSGGKAIPIIVTKMDIDEL